MSVKTYDCTSGGAQWCQGCYTMTEVPDEHGKRYGDWVRLEDYERLEKAATDVLMTYMPNFNDSRTVDDCLVGLAAAVACVDVTERDGGVES